MNILNFFNNYWTSDFTSFAEHQFSISHIMSLMIIVFLIYLTYILKDMLKEEKKEKIYSSILGIILIIHQISLYYWYIDNNKISLRESLPLYL